MPLVLSKRLALYVKGLILQYDEHYAVAIDVINREFINDTGAIVDIGAYDGDSAIYFAKSFPKKKILGFEPNPVAYKKGMVLTRPYTNITLYNLGFSSDSGTAALYLTKNQVSSSLFNLSDTSETTFDKKVEAKLTTLDEYFKEEAGILLMKLDVQGAELKILQSGKNTLSKTKLVLTEVQVTNMYAGGCLYFEVDALLRSYGFRLHTAISNYNNEGTKYFDILYINTNFLHKP